MPGETRRARSIAGRRRAACELEQCLKNFLVIGGGASGVLVAVRLLENPATRHVTLFERSPELAAGVAYGTEHPGHLLNVPASGMSAFPDEPSHFVDWIARRPKWMSDSGSTPRSFVPRRLYRDYLASLLAPHLGAENPRLSIVQSELADLVETPGGVEAVSRDGERFLADAAILATGNEGPVLPPAGWRHDCWSSRGDSDIPPDASVAIIGTGLSMVDSVISLLDAGHSGRITAISRRGLVPQPHAPCEPVRFDATEVPFGRSLASVLKWLRGKVRQHGENWRGVVDALRPYTQRLWQDFAPADKRRFLRHARPWWDVHRHRMAPQVRARIDAAEASGQLSIMSGRLAGLDEAGDGVRLRFVPRGSHVEQSLCAQHVIECRGHNSDISTTRNPLLGSLFRRGTIRPDPFRLGIDVATDCATIDAAGRRSDRLFAVGPITTGTFWEIVAVPDIRLQAKVLAARLAEPVAS